MQGLARQRDYGAFGVTLCCVNSPKGYRRTDGPIYTAYARFYWAQPMVGSDGPVRMEGHRSTRGWTSFFAG